MLRVRQDMPDVYLASVIVDNCDQPIIVAADIEHGKHTNQISAGKGGTKVSKVSEGFLTHETIPPIKRTFSFRVPDPKFAQPGFRDDVHSVIVCQNGLFVKSGDT